MLAAQVGVERVVVDGRPVPRLDRSTPTLLVPYADNLNIVGICQKEVQQLKDKITEHLNSIGFITHEEQAAEPHAEALGFLLDGVGGRVLPRPIKRDKVRKVLLWLSSQPRVNGRMIEKVIGHCVHFFMLRRECLSVFRAVYDFKKCHYEDRVVLWESAALECRQAAALLLVCHADLKRGWTGHVTCSDASLTGTGVCAAEFDIQDVCNTGSQRELWRYKSKNAAHNARDHFSKADPFTDLATVKKQKSSSEIDCFVINDEFKEVPMSFLNKESWSVVFSSKMHMPEHITLLEGRAVVQFRHSGTRLGLGLVFTRHLHFCDNLGMTLAAFSIAADLELHHRWIPSEYNAADEPSRRHESSEETFSKRRKKRLVDSIIYPKVEDLQKNNEAFVRLEKHLEGLEGDAKAIQRSSSLDQTCRDEKNDSGSHRAGEIGEEKILSTESQRLPSHFATDVLRAGCGLTPNGTGLSVSVGGVSELLQTEQAQSSISRECGLRSCDFSESVFHGWNGSQRSHQVSSSHHGCQTRAESKTCSGTVTPCSERLEELGPRDLKASRGLAGCGSHCGKTSGAEKNRAGSICFDNVRHVLPAFRTVDPAVSRPGRNQCSEPSTPLSSTRPKT